MTAHVRPGWKPPAPPDIVCPSCGGKPTKMIIYNTGDGWLMSWECDKYCGGMEEEAMMTKESDWPFVEDAARAEDFEALGFEEV